MTSWPHCVLPLTGGDISSQISAAGVDVHAVSFLSVPDPDTLYHAACLVLEIARRTRKAPAPAFNPSGGGADVARSIIEAGGLGALWSLSSHSTPRVSAVALEALATLLGTAAAMSCSAATSEAVLAVLYDGAVERLTRIHVDPALAMLTGLSGQALEPSSQAIVAKATYSLLALHYLAANPDPAVHGLFLAAAGVEGGDRGSARTGNDAWYMILSSVETGRNGCAGAGFIEAALLAAGSVCGAPPLPVAAPNATSNSRAHADEVARILPTYEARSRGPACVAAGSIAMARGLESWAVALLSGGGADLTDLNVRNVARAAIRVVWALSHGPGAVVMCTSGALAGLMGLFSARRAGGGTGLTDDMASGVLVLESIAAFLSLEDGGSKASAVSSSQTREAMVSTIGELCEIVLDRSIATDSAPQAGSSGSASLGTRSLSLLATAAGNPRLRSMLVRHPRFPAVLDLLLQERHLEGASAVSGSRSAHWCA